MVDEVKITVIATGFAALGEGEAQKEEKPAVSLKPEKKAESFVPPLIREIEATEKRLQDQAEAQAAVESAPDLNKIEEELEAEPERKGIELPAFMKKLFKR